jgi:hypothetical protein
MRTRRSAAVLLGLLIPCAAGAQQPLADAAIQHAGIVLSLLSEDRPGHELPADFALRRFEELELTEEQGARMRALKAQAESILFGALAGWPSPAEVLQLWSEAMLDDADLWLASERIAGRERQLLRQLIQLRENVLEALTPSQQERFRQLEAEQLATRRAPDAGAPPDAAAIAAAIDGSGMGLFMPHPLWVARRDADRLGLGAAERAALDRLHMTLAAHLAGPATAAPTVPEEIWTLPLAEAEALLATWHDGTRLGVARTLLQVRDAAFATVGADRRDALIALMHAGLEAQTQPRPHVRECRQGSSGGGFNLGESTWVSYSAQFRGDTAELRFLVIAPAVDAGAPQRSRPAPADVGLTSGGTVGGWWVQYEPVRGRLWIQGESVEVGDANVAILTDTDRLREPPAMAALHRIDGVIPTGGCEGTNFTNVLRAWLENVDVLQPYLRH